MMTKGLFQPLVLAGFLTTGFLIVWGVVAAWAVEFGARLARTGERERILLFLPDGTPRLAQLDFQYGENQYWDLEGNPVPPLENQHAGMQPAPGTDYLGPTVNSLQPVALPDRGSPCDTSWDRRIRSFADGTSPAVYWYFVSDAQPNGTGYFVGYDSKSCVRVGFLGTAGFRTEPLTSRELIPFGGATWGSGAGVLCSQSEWSAGHPDARSASWRAPRGSVSPSDVYVVARGGKIYHADLQKRIVHVALEEPQLCSGAIVIGLPDRVHGTPHRLAARTDNAILVLDERGQLLNHYPIPEPLRGRDVQFAETTAGEAILNWKSPFDALAREVEHRIYWVARDGHFREAEVTLPRPSEMQVMGVLCGAVMPSPLPLGGMLAVFGPGTLLEKGRHMATYWTALGRVLVAFSPALIIAQLLAAGLAVLCYRRQVRYRVSGSERFIWPLFVLALGLPGWVGYRFGLSWPVLDSCLACGVDVPRNREDCANCEAEFPGPELKGTEVFA
jgi:hypothetical protein